jgi:hypothetical protein
MMISAALVQVRPLVSEPLAGLACPGVSNSKPQLQARVSSAFASKTKHLAHAVESRQLLVLEIVMTDKAPGAAALYTSATLSLQLVHERAVQGMPPAPLQRCGTHEKADIYHSFWYACRTGATGGAAGCAWRESQGKLSGSPRKPVRVLLCLTRW